MVFKELRTIVIIIFLTVIRISGCGGEEASPSFNNQAEEPAREKENLKDLVGKYKEKQSEMEDVFKQAFKKEQDRKRLIEKKFIHAKEHIDELPDPDSSFSKE